MQERVDLCEPCVDADDRRRALGQQVVAEPTAAIHLEEQPTELTQGFRTRLEECAPLPAQWLNHPTPGIPRLANGKFRYVISKVPLNFVGARQTGELTGVSAEEEKTL